MIFLVGVSEISTLPFLVSIFSLSFFSPIAKSVTAAAKITISYFFDDNSQTIALYISLVVLTLITLKSCDCRKPHGTCPYIMVTFVPIFLASSAIAFPIFPELRFVITRIGSIYSIVLPTVTRTFLPVSNEDLLFVYLLNLVRINFKTCSGEISLAL